MASPVELENEAKLKSGAAKALEGEAGNLEKQGLLIKAKGKLQEAEDMRNEAKVMRERALLLRQQHMGKPAMQLAFTLALLQMERPTEGHHQGDLPARVAGMSAHLLLLAELRVGRGQRMCLYRRL